MGRSATGLFLWIKELPHTSSHSWPSQLRAANGNPLWCKWVRYWCRSSSEAR
jgi:hypothetical protein